MDLCNDNTFGKMCFYFNLNFENGRFENIDLE